MHFRSRCVDSVLLSLMFLGTPERACSREEREGGNDGGDLHTGRDAWGHWHSGPTTYSRCLQSLLMDSCLSVLNDLVHIVHSHGILVLLIAFTERMVLPELPKIL